MVKSQSIERTKVRHKVIPLIIFFDIHLKVQLSKMLCWHSNQKCAGRIIVSFQGPVYVVKATTVCCNPVSHRVASLTMRCELRQLLQLITTLS